MIIDLIGQWTQALLGAGSTPADGDRFASWPVPELTIELATHRSPRAPSPARSLRQKRDDEGSGRRSRRIGGERAWSRGAAPSQTRDIWAAPLVCSHLVQGSHRMGGAGCVSSGLS